MAAIGNFQRRGLFPAVLGPGTGILLSTPIYPPAQPILFPPSWSSIPSSMQASPGLNPTQLHSLTPCHRLPPACITVLHHVTGLISLTASFPLLFVTFFWHVWDRGEEASALSSVLEEILRCFFCLFVLCRRYTVTKKRNIS